MFNLKTPSFILDYDELEKNINELKDALVSEWGKYIIGYSYKTNSIPWLIEYMKKKDIWAEVVSPDELCLAKSINYEYDKIIYNGPIKTRETMYEAINKGSIVNIDSNRELNWLLEFDNKFTSMKNIGIRVNFDLEHYCPGETTNGTEGSRFGFNYENKSLENAINKIKLLKNIKLNGIHMHVSTKTRSLNIYKTLAMMANKIIKEYDIQVDYIDIGGGFFGGLPTKPSFQEYIKVIANELKDYKDNTVLIVEPGTSIISSPINFLTEVIDVKQTNLNDFVIIDGSRINIDPLFHKSNYFYKILKKQNDNNIKTKQIITGFTCMELDRLFTINNDLELKEKDRLLFEKVGAYTISLSPLFIQYYPTIYLYRDGKYKIIREKWEVKEYTQKYIL